MAKKGSLSGKGSGVKVSDADLQTALGVLGGKFHILDNKLIMLVAERMELARQVEALKHEHGDAPISRPEIEAKRIEHQKDHGVSLGLSPDFVGAFMHTIIRESCNVQMSQREMRPKARGTPLW